MKVEYDPKTLATLHLSSIMAMDFVEKRYLDLCQAEWKRASLASKFIAQFHIPDSMRLWHRGEQVSDNDEIIKLRKVWHAMYWLDTHIMARVTGKANMVLLDEFDAQRVRRVIDYFNTLGEEDEQN